MFYMLKKSVMLLFSLSLLSGLFAKGFVNAYEWSRLGQTEVKLKYLKLTIDKIEQNYQSKFYQFAYTDLHVGSPMNGLVAQRRDFCILVTG
jgi:hypothetical protein